MSTEQQVDLRVPNLQSIYHIKWSGDVSEDIDYLQADFDGSGGSSDEWEGESESELESDEEEDPDSEDSEAYVLIALCYALLISISRREQALTEDHINALQEHVAEFRVAALHGRLAIVKECLDWIQERWHSNAPFNRKKVQTVCASSLRWSSLIPYSLFAGTYIIGADGPRRNPRSTWVDSGRSMTLWWMPIARRFTRWLFRCQTRRQGQPSTSSATERLSKHLRTE
jgi:hypothetical protein